jgi:hypothetical protein
MSFIAFLNSSCYETSENAKKSSKIIEEEQKKTEDKSPFSDF